MVNISEIFKPNHWLQQLEINTYPSHTQALAGAGARLRAVENGENGGGIKTRS